MTDKTDNSKVEGTEPRRPQAPRPDAGEHKVGYGKPPKQSQFKPGQSGNPKGRKRKEPRSMTEQQVRADALHAMERKVQVTIDGKKQNVPIILVVLNKLLLKAAQGDFRCAKLAIDLRRQLMNEHIAMKVQLANTLNEFEELAKKYPDAEDEGPDPFIAELARRVYDPDVIA